MINNIKEPAINHQGKKDKQNYYVIIGKKIIKDLILKKVQGQTITIVLR